MKGFRPGKVPVAHIRKTFGEQLIVEIIQETVNETSQNMLTERDERPAMQPEIKLAGEVDAVIGGTADLVYDITYEVIPAITLTDFSKLKLEKPVAEINDERVDEALARLAEGRKNFEPRGKTAKAKDGDRVKIDFIGRIDGEAFDGGAGEGFDLELGSGQFIPGFEEQLVGTKAGDTKDVEVTFPEEYGASALAGKAAVFECTVHEVSAPKEAEINEEFATSLGMESLDKLKDAIREQIAGDYDQMSRDLKKTCLTGCRRRMTSICHPAWLIWSSTKFGTSSNTSWSIKKRKLKIWMRVKTSCAPNIVALPSVVSVPVWCWQRWAITMRFRSPKKS